MKLRAHVCSMMQGLRVRAHAQRATCDTRTRTRVCARVFTHMRAHACHHAALLARIACTRTHTRMCTCACTHVMMHMGAHTHACTRMCSILSALKQQRAQQLRASISIAQQHRPQYSRMCARTNLAPRRALMLHGNAWNVAHSHSGWSRATPSAPSNLQTFDF